MGLTSGRGSGAMRDYAWARTGRFCAACARTFAHHQKYSSKMIVAITEVCYFWWFRVESAVGATCYGVRATLLVGLVTDEKALYTGSTWGRLWGRGVRVGYRIARSGRPKKRPMLRIIGLRMFVTGKAEQYRMHSKTNVHCRLHK